MTELTRQAELLRTELARDLRIAGLLVYGSVAVGRSESDSDLDVIVVLHDAHETQCEVIANDLRGRFSRIDLSNGGVLSLARFETFAMLGDRYYWQRYDLAHAVVAFDHANGAVRRLARRKARLLAAEFVDVMQTNLAAYVEATYRSVRSANAKRRFEAHIDACRATLHAIPIVFALAGRIAPYPKYLCWELVHHPISWLGAPRPFTALLDRLLTDARPKDLKQLFALLEPRVRRRGFGEAFDVWGDKLIYALRR